MRTIWGSKKWISNAECFKSFCKNVLPAAARSTFQKQWLERVCWTRKAQMEAQIAPKFYPQEEPFPLARQFILFFNSHRAGHREIFAPKVDSFRCLWWARKGIFQTIPWKQPSQPCSAFEPEAHVYKKHNNVWKNDRKEGVKQCMHKGTTKWHTKLIPKMASKDARLAKAAVARAWAKLWGQIWG